MALPTKRIRRAFQAGLDLYQFGVYIGADGVPVKGVVLAFEPLGVDPWIDVYECDSFDEFRIAMRAN